jgi:hypothetical protein
LVNAVKRGTKAIAAFRFETSAALPDVALIFVVGFAVAVNTPSNLARLPGQQVAAKRSSGVEEKIS